MTNQSSITNRQLAIRASAPGSLMLLGEHAVLHGRRALVCAINRRMTVFLTPLGRPFLRIVSDLGTYESPLDDLKDHPDFRFVLDAVKQYPLAQGIELKIESEFSSDIGFGSSAAVTVATHAALMQLVEPDRRAGFEMDLFKRSLATIHRVQGRGSGADVAASVFGGVVAYRAEPLEIVPLKQTFPLTAVYSGSKMKTADVIRYLEERRTLNADYFERIFDRMDASVGEALRIFGGAPASVPADGEAAVPPLREFGELLVRNQKLMEEMGLCNAALAEIIGIFQGLGIPAKISGSGLGDCAVGLGSFPAIGKYQTFALQVESRNGDKFYSTVRPVLQV
jgi:mevalonate kinase